MMPSPIRLIAFCMILLYSIGTVMAVLTLFYPALFGVMALVMIGTMMMDLLVHDQLGQVPWWYRLLTALHTEAASKPVVAPAPTSQEHQWMLIMTGGVDSPGNGMDVIHWCQFCGAIKRDFFYDGGYQNSKYYPQYFFPDPSTGLRFVTPGNYHHVANCPRITVTPHRKEFPE